MRKVLVTCALVIGCLAPAVASAQGVLPPYFVRAEEFNGWSLASQAANTYTFAGTNCYVSPLTQGFVNPFFAFGPAAAPFPVLIRDANPTTSEIVTPSTVSTVTGACGFAASPSNAHTSFTVSSGTAGLQEAVATLKNTSTAQAAVVVADQNFYTAVAGLPGSKTVGGIIQALKNGSTGVQVVDTTTAPWTYYIWNGAAYFANGGGTPTVAAGAGLGTAPTGLVLSGNGAQGIVSVTAGTSTATGTLFTITFHSGTTADGFNHSPVCTVGSVGANTPAGTLAAGSVGGSAAAGFTQPVTIATTALTASTFYSFSYSCK